MARLKEHLIMWPALTVLGLALFGLLYGIHTVLPEQKVVYNCSIAEISPDFTPTMKQECRRLRLEKK